MLDAFDRRLARSATATCGCAWSATARCAATTPAGSLRRWRTPCSWAGRVDWNRPRYYASADVFCTPCQRASFGMVLLEAMSCGRPVVASMISGFEMLLTSGREGLLVAPPDEPSAFAAALGHLLDSPDERARMGAEGRVTATTRYSWVSVAAELEAYYRELRGERARAARARAGGTRPGRGARTRLTRCRAWDASPPAGCLRSPGWRSSSRSRRRHGGGHLPDGRDRAAQARARDRLPRADAAARARAAPLGRGRRGARRDGRRARLRGSATSGTSRSCPAARATAARRRDRRRSASPSRRSP